jgi:tyrosine-protein phosphatase OCA1
LALLDDLAIRIIYVDNPGRSTAVSEELVVNSLHALINPDNHPLLLACASGRFLTGAVVGCLRKMQHWSLVSVFEEYRRFAGQRLHQQHEQFVELFDTDLVTLTSCSAEFVQK